MKIGKAQFGNRFVQRKTFGLKDGDQVYRILPPLGDLADSGRWSMFYSVHWGYKTTDGKLKPFVSPEVRNKKGMIEVPDAAKERLLNLTAKYDEAKKADNKPVLEKLEPLVGFDGGLYSLDKKHYMNVVDAQGNIGVLKIGHKCKLALEAELKALDAEGVNALSPDNGRFFVFNKSGTFRDTTFGVKVLKQKINIPEVGIVEKAVVHVLDDDLLNRLNTEASKLDKLFKRLTAEEVKKVVETSDLQTGVSTYLDELFAKKDGAFQAHIEESPQQEVVLVEAKQPAVVVAPKPVVAAPVVAKTTATLVTEMTNEEFLEKLHSGNL